MPTLIRCIAEDILTSVVLLKLVQRCPHLEPLLPVIDERGKDNLRKRCRAYAAASVVQPVVMLTDLDREPCPTALTSSWLPGGIPANCLLRIAVREVEAWLMADTEGFAQALAVRTAWIPDQVDALADPKSEVLRLSRKSSKSSIRRDVPPQPGRPASIGPGYNDLLRDFVKDTWDPVRAALKSPSLARSLQRMERFRPHLPGSDLA